MISCFLPRLLYLVNSFRRESWQEAESHGQSLQEARDHGQSRWRPNMTDSLCRKRKLADSIIPCDDKNEISVLLSMGY